MQGRVELRPGKPRRLCEDHWLNFYVQTYGLSAELINDVDLLLDRYKHLVEGYLVYDTQDVIQTQNLAITRAGLEKLLPVAADQEHWMIRHGIRKRDDLRGGFTCDADAAEWAIHNLWPHCYRRIYANFCVHRPLWYSLTHELEDFIVYHRGFALDLPLSRQTRRTLYLYRRMLESGEGPGVQMNWHCVCDQEKEYVDAPRQTGGASGLRRQSAGTSPSAAWPVPILPSTEGSETSKPPTHSPSLVGKTAKPIRRKSTCVFTIVMATPRGP